MATFTTRVELHDANYSDYENLHSQMKKQGFSRTITADDGTTYHLPTAEYDYSGSKTRAEVLALAKTAASATGKKYAALVTESKGRTWFGLQKV